MCGIAGIVDLHGRHGRPSRDRAARARWPARCAIAGPTSSASTATRAPASRMRGSRSSISSTGQQPLGNEDGTLWVVFNGEIFNYVELRAELEALGHRFRTQSDTEVIVHAYEAWGDGAFRALQRPVGDRAVGRARRSVCSWRATAVGVRPLYVCEHAGVLYFASEVKAIFAADPSIPRELRSRRSRADVHVLDGGPAADASSRGVGEISARLTCAPTKRGRADAPTGQPRIPS